MSRRQNGAGQRRSAASLPREQKAGEEVIAIGPVRFSAMATLGLLVAYSILRAVGGGCTTSQCDVTVLPLSALLPLLILVLVAVTGALPIAAAKRGIRIAQNPAVKGRHATWLVVLGACTVVGVLGPLVLLAVLGNNPNLFVFLATVLVALTPLGALIYTLPRMARGARADFR